MPSPLRDNPARFGLVTRLFHWIMAYLILWQFVTLIGWKLIGDGPFMRTISDFGPAHGTVGILVFALAIPRALWAFASRTRRPDGRGLPFGRLAKAAHHGFYLLMFVVPALALVRTYGNGKGLTLWGIDLIAKTGREIAWLIAPANLLHAPLAWTLAVLLAGHIAMALYHGLVRRDGVLARMAGPLRS